MEGGPVSDWHVSRRRACVRSRACARNAFARMSALVGGDLQSPTSTGALGGSQGAAFLAQRCGQQRSATAKRQNGKRKRREEQKRQQRPEEGSSQRRANSSRPFMRDLHRGSSRRE